MSRQPNQEEALRVWAETFNEKDLNRFQQDISWLKKNRPGLVQHLSELLSLRWEERVGNRSFAWFYTFLFLTRGEDASPWRSAIFNYSRLYAYSLDNPHLQPPSHSPLADNWHPAGVKACVDTCAERMRKSCRIDISRMPLAACIYAYSEDLLMRGVRPEIADTRNSLLGPDVMRVFLKAIKSKDSRDGKALEALVELLFLSTGGYRVLKDLSSSAPHGISAGGFQIDLLAEADMIFSDYRDDFGRFVACECKDYASPIGVDRVGKFIGAMEALDVKLGIIFAKRGVSGRAGPKDQFSIKALRRVAARGSRMILVVTLKDLERLVNEEISFPNLLREVYVKTRFEL